MNNTVLFCLVIIILVWLNQTHRMDAVVKTIGSTTTWGPPNIVASAVNGAMQGWGQSQTNTAIPPQGAAPPPDSSGLNGPIPIGPTDRRTGPPVGTGGPLDPFGQGNSVTPVGLSNAGTGGGLYSFDNSLAGGLL